MTPYYDEDGITIYHGDCQEILPAIESDNVSLVLTDPPYGINNRVLASSKPLRSGSPNVSQLAGETIEGDQVPFDPSPWLTFNRVILFGANHFANRLPLASWLVWDKTGGGKARGLTADAELAWRSWGRGVDVFHHLWLGVHRDSEAGPRGLRGVHPNQKPVELMRWILNRWTEPGDLILDPYMGSGPVAKACYEMGRRYIGIEIEEKYCKIAVQRLAQGVLSFEDDVATTN